MNLLRAAASSKVLETRYRRFLESRDVGQYHHRVYTIASEARRLGGPAGHSTHFIRP